MMPGSTEIRRAENLPVDISRLVELSAAEGFKFVARLVEEWESGSNRFADVGECFVEARCDSQLAAICGLNRDPYADSGEIARLRHLYVDPQFRTRGIGRLVVEHLVSHAKTEFRVIRLRTDNRIAARLYETIGFERVSDIREATHLLEL